MCCWILSEAPVLALATSSLAQPAGSPGCRTLVNNHTQTHCLSLSASLFDPESQSSRLPDQYEGTVDRTTLIGRLTGITLWLKVDCFCPLCSERRLHTMGQLVDHPNEIQYFWPNLPVGPVQDDHMPFLNRGAHTCTHTQRHTHTKYTYIQTWIHRHPVLILKIFVFLFPFRCACPPPYPQPIPFSLAHI